ncbi:hypothetical protein [Acinetobacter sp.]|uniref:hypothetical protein n=1 Tax=Acinetobacter sp. TaxID=472 RepID=UPI0028AC1519|nr:hypothetical protein [Acinetobacter sp.]
MKKDLERILQIAFKNAKQQCNSEESCQLEMIERKKHNDRSKQWIAHLSAQLLQLTKESNKTNDQEFCAFYRNNANLEDRKIFGLNEFLFDIVIAQMIEFESAHKKAKFKAIRNAKWLVESEFQTGTSRPLLLDINKLALGTTENKLFIMSNSDKSIMKSWVTDTIKKLMHDEKANVFLAVVPHPRDWKNKDIIEVEQIV